MARGDDVDGELDYWGGAAQDLVKKDKVSVIRGKMILTRSMSTTE